MAALKFTGGLTIANVFMQSPDIHRLELTSFKVGAASLLGGVGISLLRRTEREAIRASRKDKDFNPVSIETHIPRIDLREFANEIYFANLETAAIDGSVA
jgi:hypothetical protein